MTTVHDDFPHPIPPLAYLRYKENYFFIIMAPENSVHGIVHLNFEPGQDRARYSCHLSVQGKACHYVSETALPEKFEMARTIGDGKIQLSFIKPHEQFDLSLNSDDLTFKLTFEKSLPTFDYAPCRAANPETPSFQEVMTLGTNLPYNHQQQALTVNGTVITDGNEITISGKGYRDHSWCVRTDNIVASHTWSGHHFGNRAFGVKKLHTLARPGLWAREGYVSDADGERALKNIEVIYEGKSTDGLPEIARFELSDVLGKNYTLICDVAARYAQVPLVAEKPGKHGAYQITENFCPSIIEETGETGCSLVEIGTSKK